MTTPVISVILPVYNAELYVIDSINSILNQTYKSFELIIIDDGSQDRSKELIESFHDDRIKFYSTVNSGMAATLNFGLQLSKGKYIARQDGDDISHSDRFEKQIAFMENNSDIVLTGTWAKVLSLKKDTEMYLKHPTDNLTLKLFLLFDNPFVHSSIMIRKSVIDDIGNYDLAIPPLIQDYDLWSRVAERFEIANIGEILVDYRETEGSISRTTNDYYPIIINQAAKIIQQRSGMNSKYVKTLAALFHGKYYDLPRFLPVFKLLKIYRLATNSILINNLGDSLSFNLLNKIYKSRLLKRMFLYSILGKMILKFRP